MVQNPYTTLRIIELAFLRHSLFKNLHKENGFSQRRKECKECKDEN